VHVCLGALDVVMKIVAENLDPRDSFLTNKSSGIVTREEDCTGIMGT